MKMTLPMLITIALILGCGSTEPVSSRNDAGTGGMTSSTGGQPGTGGANSGGKSGTGGSNTGGTPTGGSNTGGMGHTGGVTPTGGAGVTGGASGKAGNGGAAGGRVPSCLQALFDACPTTGTCKTASTSTSTTAYRYCFASGVTADFSTAGGCTGNGKVVLTVRKADGSPCYAAEVVTVQGTFCESETFTWTNAAGTIIATSRTETTGEVTVQCAGTLEDGTCPTGSQCRLGSERENNTCTAGTTCP